MAWYCKANPKINPSRLETKPDEPHPHTFKCINCKGEHMANNTKWPFWKYHFNCKWHIRKVQETQEIRANSTCLAIGGKNLWISITFLQNIRKNKILTDTILETQKNVSDIIFIQEPPRFLIQCLPAIRTLLETLFMARWATLNRFFWSKVSQTSFGHISINSSTISTVLMVLESPQEDLSINTSHISRRSILAKILSKLVDKYHSTTY